MPEPTPFLLNPHRRALGLTPSAAADVRSFHTTLPDYALTPLVSLPAIAAEIGLGAVLVKDESSRLGLPAFKMLGASWAIHRAVTERDRAAPPPRLATATDGNHGRAVARMAALLGLSATVYVPRGVSGEAIQRIRDEGARVEVRDADYDDTVRYAADVAEADESALLIQDTSWPGYEEVPQWIVDGYATLFDEAAEQVQSLGMDIDVLVVPAGVGSLAHAAVTFARTQSDCQVVTVEPVAAAGISASIVAGEITPVTTGETMMAGLNCGTPSYLAWPDLLAGLTGASTVNDNAALSAMAELARQGVDSGPCGAASLASLRILASEPARSALGLTSASTALLLNTEGVSAAH